MSLKGSNLDVRLVQAVVLMALGCTAAANGASAGEKARPLAVGDVLPRLEGDYLTGRDAVLPEAVRGRVALLALGFTYDSRYPVEEWSRKFRAEFGGNPKVTHFEVPMIGGLGRLGRPFINRGMRRGTPEELHENVITVYGGTGPWKERLEVRDDKLAYLILLDREGRVVWLHSGLFSQEKFVELVSKTRESATED